jgi:hypothetical protein
VLKEDLAGGMKGVYIIENVIDAKCHLFPSFQKKNFFQFIVMNVGGEINGKLQIMLKITIRREVFFPNLKNFLTKFYI